jgi:hypothetical protein
MAAARPHARPADHPARALTPPIRAGVPAVAARTSALAHLLHTVPPAILAQLIGMSAHSAERYSAALPTDYSHCLALRVGADSTPNCGAPKPPT